MHKTIITRTQQCDNPIQTLHLSIFPLKPGHHHCNFKSDLFKLSKKFEIKNKLGLLLINFGEISESKLIFYQPNPDSKRSNIS